MSGKKRKQKDARAARNKRKREERVNLTKELLDDCWSSYAKNWEHHSECFRKDEHYQWMAGFLAGRDRILEIGTGDGSGTIAMYHHGSTILSIDHNPRCLDIAEARLAEAKVPCKSERRGQVEVNSDGFTVEYSAPQSEVTQGEVLLLEGDIGNGEESYLAKWLYGLPKFDAVACWNIGTYTLLRQSFGTPEQYRLRVQNVAYEIAERILVPGGILHIVDRAPEVTILNDDEMVSGLIECHEDQASVTSLKIDASSIVKRNFVLDSGESDIVMKQKHESGGFTNSPNQLAFWSIVATKP